MGKAWFGCTYQFTKKPISFLCDTIVHRLAPTERLLLACNSHVPAERAVHAWDESPPLLLDLLALAYAPGW